MTFSAPKSRLQSFFSAICLTCSLAIVGDTEAQTDHPRKQAIEIFSAAEKSASVVGTLSQGETATPLAEISTANGEKWFLIRAKSGITGWLRQGDYEQFKKLDQYFRELPRESTPLNQQTIASPSRNMTSGGEIVVPIRTNGSVVIVRATFNAAVDANLILDTGASTTLISKDIARRLSLYESGMQTAQTVNGAITMPTSRIESVRVGDAEVQNVAVSIHDLRPGGGIDGLLGLNFLNRFEFSLDLKKRQLILSPR